MPLPEDVVAEVNSYNELLPGVPANNENLQTLLQFLKDRQRIVLGPQTEAFVELMNFGDITVHITNPEYPGSGRVRMAKKELALDEQGLHKAIVWAKYSLKRYREEGPCPGCNNSEERPWKRLRADKMPKCEECILKAAVGV